jgi:hypothetical protein
MLSIVILWDEKNVIKQLIIPKNKNELVNKN